jgi:phosphoribosylformylglycinamidine synthase subunit PurL
MPTPTIGGVGLLPDWTKMAKIAFAGEDECILIAGAPDCWGSHLGQSIYMRDIHGLAKGPAPHVDLQAERKTGDFVRKLIREGAATAVHDCSDGGLALALAEMAMASGIGATINELEGVDPIPVFFGEDQGRYVVTVKRDDLDAVLEAAAQSDVFMPWIGTTGGKSLKLGDARAIKVADLKAAHESWFPAFMNG